MAPREAIDASVAVVIVNWRSADLVADCLRSLVDERELFQSFQVKVVDNASGDGSDDKLQSLIDSGGWDSWVELLRAPTNGGFASGNNIGIRAVRTDESAPDYILLLNPDTWIRPGAILALAKFMTTRPETGIAGGRSEDPDGTPQHCCFRFPGIISELAGQLNLGIVDRLAARRITRIGIPEEPTEVGWVSGGVMMVRWQLFEQLGLMDESYFLYFEETDFTLRAQRAGWRCWHVPQSRVVHLVGQSSGVTKREGAPARVPGYWFESRRRYFLQNHGVAYTMLADLGVIAGALLARVRALVQRGQREFAPHYLGDFIRHSVWLKGRRGLEPRRTAW